MLRCSLMLQPLIPILGSIVLILRYVVFHNLLVSLTTFSYTIHLILLYTQHQTLHFKMVKLTPETLYLLTVNYQLLTTQ